MTAPRSGTLRYMTKQHEVNDWPPRPSLGDGRVGQKREWLRRAQRDSGISLRRGICFKVSPYPWGKIFWKLTAYVGGWTLRELYTSSLACISDGASCPHTTAICLEASLAFAPGFFWAARILHQELTLLHRQVSPFRKFFQTV